MNYRPLPPLEELKKLYRYDSATGLFYWLVDRGQMKAGQIAGGYSADRCENTFLKYGKRQLQAHRLAWLFHYGVDPGDYQVDHINKNRLDNRIENLRLATHQENQRNTKGVGVSWHKQKQKWRSYIVVNYKQISGGLHQTYDSALEATKQLKRKHFGDFSPV